MNEKNQVIDLTKRLQEIPHPPVPFGCCRWWDELKNRRNVKRKNCKIHIINNTSAIDGKESYNKEQKMDKKMRLAILLPALAATAIMILKVTKVFA